MASSPSAQNSTSTIVFQPPVNLPHLPPPAPSVFRTTTSFNTSTTRTSGSRVTTPAATSFIPKISVTPTTSSTTSFPLSTASASTASTSASSTGSIAVNLPGQDLVQSQSVLSKGGIIAIAVSVSLVVGCLIVLLVCLVLRRQRAHKSRQQGAPSQNVDSETLEKYGGAHEYAYSKYQDASAETQGTLPLLKASFDRSRRGSSQSGEFGQFQYSEFPPSPLVLEEADTTHMPLTHAVSLADATPHGLDIADGQFHNVDLVSTSNVSTPKASPQIRTLPPIVIPEDKVTSRRSTYSKRTSRRSSRHTYGAVDGGEMSDGDSESMYSQASAYTLQSASPQGTQTPTFPDFRPAPMATIPQSPVDSRRYSTSTIKPSADFSTSSSTALMAYDSEILPTPEYHGEDGPKISSEDAVLVAKLLKSRMKYEQPLAPSRSESLVSHIERKGSIKPAFGPDEFEEENTRPLRLQKKSRDRSSRRAGHADAS